MCSCFVCLAQILVWPLNFLIAILGGITIALGVVIKKAEDEFGVSAIETLNVPVEPVAIELIVIGSLILLLSLAGCIGACRKITCLLLLNVTGLAVFAAGKIYILVVFLKFLGKIENNITRQLSYLFEDTTLIASLHALEYALECCGVEGASSYASAGLVVPITCCPIDIDEISEDFDYNNLPEASCTDYYGGCVTAFMKFVNKYANPITYGLGFIILIEVATILLHLFIACFGRRKK